MDGNLTVEEFEQVVNLATEGCRQLYALQKKALEEKYVTVSEEVEEE
jgi:exosome complex component RRP41